MPKSKFFFASVILLAVMFVFSGIGYGKPIPMTVDDVLLRSYQPPTARPTPLPQRDFDDNFYTLRWRYSANGGETWSDFMNAGDAGMWAGPEGMMEAVWGENPDHMGVAVDSENNIHFAVILNAFGEGDANPHNRTNGLYHVMAGKDGANAAYHMIAAEGDMSFVYADIGIAPNGDIFAIWVSYAEEVADIMASKSTDDGANWSEPVTLVADQAVPGGDLDSGNPYPHMTAVGADKFYMMYQMQNDVVWDQYIMEVPTSLAGQFNGMATGSASGSLLSYWYGACNPVAYDPATGDVYFAHRSDDLTSTKIGNLTGGQWSVGQIDGAQRYPSVGLDTGNRVPWAFSNRGLPAAGAYHKNWYAFDETGYNGGSWTGQIEHDSVMYDGVRDLLYVHNGVWTTTGRLVTGTAVWGQSPIEGYQISYSDNAGESWSEAMTVFDIFADSLKGGTVPQAHIVAGADNHVFVAFTAKFGPTDLIAPEVSEPTLSSFALGEVWRVSSHVQDEIGVVYTDVNWYEPADPATINWMQADSMADDVDEFGNGTYFYTMPSDSIFGHAIENGDSIYFYTFAQDEAGNIGVSYDCLIIVGSEYQSVRSDIVIPTGSELGQNYPNPFNNSTVIPFSLKRAGWAKVQIWDTNGRLVKTLHNGWMKEGFHKVSFNTTGLAGGVYIYSLETNGARYTSKMSLVH